jgi:enoyl-CoA hydratase/carnithine racemase
MTTNPDRPGREAEEPSGSDSVTTYDVSDGVAVLRMDRPQARNAMNTQMLEEMLAHIASARADDQARALVVSSTDHLGLSAGADVREELDEERRVHRMQLFADLYDDLVGFPKPTIAVCHGACVGGGAEVAVACDIRVGGSNVRLRFPGASLGVPVGPARLVTLCGLSVAKYLLISGKEVAADEALRWGLVHKVAPAAAAEEMAIQIATTAASHPPEAVARLKAMLHEWDGIVERSKTEGEGQVEWQRSGPGLPFHG